MPEEPTGPDLVAFDVGNTSVKAAVRRQGRWELLLRVPTRPAEDLPRRLHEAAETASTPTFSGQRWLVCCVCPPAERAVISLSETLGWGRPLFFGRDLPVPMDTRVEEPRKVGTDRLVLALGARELHGAPCVVVSAGTAITVDLVDAAGALAGGAIAPGLGLAADALHEKTASLPRVEPAAPARTLGRNTIEALTSGVYWSCAGGVLALVEGLRREEGCATAPIVCTGTDAPLLLPALERFGARHEPHLIFKGMAAALAR